MGNIAGYIANLGKSVSYAAVDKMKKMSPSSAEFASSNADLFKDVYTSVRDYKVTYKRGLDVFSKSKIYEAGDILKNSLIEDIKTGKLYNKEREDKMSMKFIGGDMSDDGFDDSSFNINFDDFDGFDMSNDDFNDITTGDKVISTIVDKSNRKSAEMISMSTARTGEYIVENQKMSTNLLYTQSLQTHSMLQGNLTSINENISTMLNFSDKVLKTHVDNSSKYYEESTKLLQDQTALLRELVTYMKPVEKKSKTTDRITYDDIVGAEGTPDLKLYYKNIMKNISSNSGMGMFSSMGDMFGENSNVLAMLATSPLKFIPEAIVNTIIPKTIESSMENLDKSIGNLFGSMMVKFNTMASSDDFLQSLIGKTFGVRSTAKDTIDTSNYEKGKVDWDGKSRKALIEVIPTHLAKIVSLLSGESEKVYDYDKGRFISADSVKDEYNKRVKSYSNSATSEMHDYMKEYMKVLTFDSIEERKRMQEDMEKFFTKLYKENKLFDVNSSTLDQDHMDYGIDAKNFRTIRAMFKNAPKYMQHQINSEILNNRNRQTRDFEELEKNNDSVLQYMFNGSNLNEYIKKNKLERKSSSILTNSLNGTVDNFGRNIFYYLQNMYRELSFIRQYNGGIGTGRIQDPLKVYASNGSTYVPQEKTINDIQISRNPKKSSAESESERIKREEERFRRSELRRREKNGDLINYSQIDDEKELENNISAMIKLDQVNRRLEYEDSRKPTLIDRLLEAESLSEKTKIMIDKVVNVSKKPVEFITSTIEKVDQRMYEFIYGKEDASGNDIKGFLDLTLYELRSTFSKFNVFMDEKILTPLKEKLDVDSFKDGFKKLLSKMGIDTDEVSKSIKEFFFGDKDSGKQGIFSSTIDATKNSFKSAFNVVKDSVKSTLSPAINKGRELFKGKNQFAHLYNEDDDSDTFYDENGNIVQNESSLQQRIDNIVMNKNITGKTQEYYDSLSFNSKEDELYFAKNNYIAGKSTLIDDKSELIQIDNKISKLKSILNNSRGKTAKNISKQIKELEKRKQFLKDNLGDYYRSENKYKNNLKEKKYSNINNYYKESISSIFDNNSEVSSEVINRLFDDNKSSFDGRVNFTAEDLMRTARNLSKDDGKYESVVDNMANYLDKYYNSDIKIPLSRIADDSGKLIDPDNWYRTKGLPTNAEEFYDQFPNLINSNELLLDEISETNDTQIPLIKQIADDLRILKDTLFANIKSSIPKSVGPRVGLNPNILTHPEGGAIQSFSQDLVTMISNWMFGNTPKYNKGGYIHETTVATIGKGEVVLSAENVEKLTSLFNDLIGGVKDKKKSNSEIASTAFDPLLKMSDELGLEDLSTVKDLINSNPEMNKAIKSMSFSERRNYSSIMKSLEGKIKNRNNIDEKGVSLDPVQQALYEDTKPFVHKMGEELVSGMGAVKRSLFGESDKQQSKAFGDVLNDVTDNISKYAPDAIGSGLVGAGVSLLTGAIGGPLLGAAVGAGYSLTKNSDKVQNWLFGESIDGKRQGGLINKKIIDVANKYLPDMKAYGITGALAGFLTPLGPIGGLMAGSALGFAKNNESVMSTLFGDEGLFKPESKDKLKKALPKVALGALAGGMVGPFGLLGNLALGSGLGLAASTDDFKQAILGRYDEKDKKFKGGLLPTMRDTIIDPLKSFGKDVKDGAMDYIKKHMILPLTSAVDPIKKELSLIVKGTFDNIGDFVKGLFKETFAPLTKWMEDKIMRPIGGFITKFIKGSFKLGTGLATLPFKAIGGLGDGLRKKHIKQGNADYMTAEERLSYANEKGIRYDNEFDAYLNTLSDEDASSLFETLSSIENSGKSIRQLRKDIGRETGDTLATYVNYNKTRDIMDHIKSGNLDKAKNVIIKNKKGLFRNQAHNLSKEEQDKVLSFIDKQYGLFHNVEQNKKEADEKRYSLYDELRKKGFKDISDKNVGKYLSMIQKETKSDKKKDKEEQPVDLVLQVQKENHNEIVSLIEEAIRVMKGVEENTEVPVERNVGKKEDNNKSLIQELADAQTMTQIDPYGNVIELKKTSDGELEADMSDSSTAKAISIANEERESKQSFMSKMSEGFGFLKPSSEEDKKKRKEKGLLGWLLDLIPGNIKTAGLMGAGLLFAPQILKFTKEHVMPLASGIWEDNIKPWISEKGIPMFREGLVGVVRALPGMIIDGVKFGITELAPALLSGIRDILGFGEKDTLGESITDTAVRQIATGGRMSTAGLDALQTVNNSAKAASEGVSTASKLGSSIARIMKNPFKLANPVEQVKGMTKMSMFAGNKAFKLGGKLVNGAAEKVSSIYNKIDNVAIKGNSLKSFSDSIKKKFTSGAEAVGTAMIKFSQEETFVANAMKKMSEFFSKFLSNPKTIDILGTEITEKMAKIFVPNFIERLGKSAIKNAGKIGAKIGGAFLTGGLLNMVFAVTDFISGYNDAQNILGIIEEPTLGMKVASGLLKSINGLFIITSLVPEKVYVDILLDTLLPVFGKDDSKLQQMRKDANERIKQYKDENKITGKFTVRDFNNQVKAERKKLNPADRNGNGKVSIGEKVVNFGSSVVNKVKEFGSNVWSGVKNIGNNVKKFLFGKGDSTTPSVGMGASMGKGTNGNTSSSYPSKIHNFTYFSQGDPRWNTKSIDGTTVKKAGCGPTSMSMIVSELTGQTQRPDDFVRDAYEKGHWNKNGAQWTLFKYFADKYNLPYQEAGTYSRFQELAAAGIPQAVSGKTNGASGTPFTSGGHIITVLGTDGNGNYIVNDPVSPARSKLYPNEKIKVGWRNSWGFGSPGTYDATSGVTSAQYSNTTSEATAEATTQESGLNGIFDDFTKTATNSFNKIYGFDELNKQSVSSSELAGMGGIDDKTDINPIAATDFEDISTVSKIKAAIKRVGNVLDEFKPFKASKEVISKAKEELLNRPKYNGMGGVDEATKTVKLIKGIPIGSKSLNDKVQAHDAIFKKAGAEFGVDPELLKAICMQESKGEDIRKAARGLMQIENGGTTKEFINFGKNRPDGPYNEADRSIPSKAIPFAAKRLADDFRHYSGDFLKTTQAYNFSKYSLDKLLKAFPEGDTWLSQRQNVGKYNGTGRSKYGDPKYIEHVFQYYQGNNIPSDGIGTVTGGSGVATTGGQEQETRSGFDGLIADLGDLFTGGFNKLYGLDEIFPTADAATGTVNGVGELDPNAPKVADDWFTRTLNGRMTSKYGPRIHPIKKTQSIHTGVDYGASGGTPILSPVQGTVKHVASSTSGYGNRIEITDTMGGVHLFAHMKEKAKLKVGDKVNLNQEVGKVGTTGSSTGNHLHYEVRQGGGTSKEHVEPNSYLSKYLDKIWSSTNSNKGKTTTGMGGVDQSPKNKYTGMGGVDQKYKAPKIKLSDTPKISNINNNENTGFNNKLLSVIIEILSKIADNTNCLTDIVQLLSNSLNIEIPEETVNQMKNNNISGKSGTKQIVTMIKESIKDSTDPNNEYLLKTLNQLATE